LQEEARNRVRGKRPDLSNATLSALTAAAAVALGLYFAVAQRALPEAWRTPGSPELYLTGVAGALLLLVSMAFVLVKRTGAGGSPPAWFVAHVLGGTAGAVLVAIHSAGHLRRPPALLFLLIIFLVFLGLWGRIRLARRMAGTFASKQGSFALAKPEAREKFAGVIAAKRALLAQLDPKANEGTFSLTLTHWLGAPRISARYARLVREENRLMGMRESVGLAQAYWRAIHMAIAYLFVLGIVIHVITVTFFAGYVADGGPITWWHLTDWGK
jgi:hypothetical protein